MIRLPAAAAAAAAAAAPARGFAMREAPGASKKHPPPVELQAKSFSHSGAELV